MAATKNQHNGVAVNNKEVLHDWLRTAPLRRLGIVNTRFEFVGNAEHFFIMLRSGAHAQPTYDDGCAIMEVW